MGMQAAGEGTMGREHTRMDLRHSRPAGRVAIAVPGGRRAFFLLALWLGAACGTQENAPLSPPPVSYVVPPAHLAPPPWPEWALEHWVWEDESTQDSARQLVEGYLQRDVPVGAVIIDSPWETGYNTFEFDTGLYPDPEGMIRTFHDMGVRVFLWIVSMINEDAPNFAYARDRGFFIKNASGEDFMVEWWKGTGGMLDYTNAEAVAWWHGQMDTVLDWGVDGWKVDGTDFAGYVLSLFLGGMFGEAGQIRPQEYSAMYYGDFFHYTRERLGPDRIITARPVDSYGTFIPLAFAPGDVNLAGWVGDQDPTFSGLRNALFNLFASSGVRFESEKAYVNYGSDIGGYRGDDKRDKDLLIRWAQLGAFCPVMENGGSGEHRPWMYDEQTLDIYRAFVCLHHQLIPYLYSQGAEAYAAGRSLMVPVGSYALQGMRWEYMIGEALFVSAIARSGESVVVEFPEGEWMDWFTREVFAGGSTRALAVPLEDYPVFLRRGSVVPLQGVAGCAACGLPVPESTLLWVVWPGDRGAFRLHEEAGSGMTVAYERDGDGLVWECSATPRMMRLLLLRMEPVASVVVAPTGQLTAAPSLEAWETMESGWFQEVQGGDVWIKPGRADLGLRVRVQVEPGA